MAYIALPGEAKQWTRDRDKISIEFDHFAVEKNQGVNIWATCYRNLTGEVIASGCLYSLSIQQVRILDLLTTRFRIIRQNDLPWVLLKISPYRPQRGKPLTSTQRASISRSVRRLREHGFISVAKRPYQIGVTQLGARIISLFRETNCWPTYTERLRRFDADER